VSDLLEGETDEQVRSEITSLLGLVRGAETILEIGSGWGGALFIFTRVSPKDATLLSVDLWTTCRESMRSLASYTTGKATRSA
jgi:cyclopropane fatty-acyl-phospholipid synthase-like methyltransferase